MASIEPEPSKEPESDPFASYYMTPEQIRAHDKAEAKRQAQELAKQAASPWCDPTVSKAAALAGLSSAASTAFAPADVFSTLGSVADLQTCKDYVADLQLLEHARLVGIDVDKMPAGTLRGLGIDGLFALKQQQDNAKQMEQVMGSLSASTSVSAALAGLPSSASAAAAASSLADTFSAHSTVAGWQAGASAVDAVSAAVTALGPSADAYQLSKAIAIGIDVDKMPAGTLRGLGTGELFALKQQQDNAKQMEQVLGSLSAPTSVSAVLAGLPSAASSISAMPSLADTFSAHSTVAGWQAGASSVDAVSAAVTALGPSADAYQLSKAIAIGIDVDKIPAGTLRGLGIDGLFALKQQQDNAKQMEQVMGSLSAPTSVSAALAGLPSSASAAAAASSLADTFSAHSTVAGWQAGASAVDAVSAAVTALGPSADAYQLSKAIAIGIDVDKMPAGTLRGLGTDGLLMLWQEQELSKQMASLRGDLSASASISSAMAGLTSTTFAASAMGDVFGSVSAAASISGAMAAIARHSSGLEPAWLSVHTGGVDQYTKELAHLIQPLASIREAIGTWDGVLATQFDHLAGTSTYLQASGVAADVLLKFAWEPANRDVSPAVIAGRFMRGMEDWDGYTEIITIQAPVRHQPPVQPTGISNLEQRVAELEVDNAEMRVKLARMQATLDEVVSRLSEPTSPPVAPAGAEVVQTAKAPPLRQAAQEDAILQAIRAAGHDPKRLPNRTPGKSGIKVIVRAAVQDGKGMFTGSKVFEKAWERLRKTGEISDT